MDDSSEVMVLNGSGGGGSRQPITGRVSMGKLRRPGDILVTAMTSPTHLVDMMRAGAVVTDQGGEMSHAAVVCRDEGIPYVIGTQNATQMLTDGMEVTVDPMTKTVRWTRSRNDA